MKCGKHKCEETIWALGVECKFFACEEENANGEWKSDGYGYKDGFAVTHHDGYHHVYVSSELRQ